MTKRASIVISILISALMLGSAEYWAYRNSHTVKFNDTFTQNIRSAKPDIIFVGNSTLKFNVDPVVMQAELSKRLGREFKVLFLSRSSMHSAWQYLVLKNQILKSSVANIPVVFVDYEHFFFLPEVATGSGAFTEKQIKVQMLDQEEVLLSKIGGQAAYFKRHFPYLVSQGSILKRELSGEAVAFIGKFLMPDSLLAKRYGKVASTTLVKKILSKVFSPSSFRSGLFTLEPARVLSSNKLTDKATFRTYLEKTFIPEMLKIQGSLKFIFVVSLSNPKFVDNIPELVKGNDMFRDYLKEHGIPLIDMNAYPQIHEGGYMSDSRHISAGPGKVLNTQLMAAELAPLLR